MLKRTPLAVVELAEVVVVCAFALKANVANAIAIAEILNVLS
jgi:hypothetical protein